MSSFFQTLVEYAAGQENQINHYSTLVNVLAQFDIFTKIVDFSLKTWLDHSKKTTCDVCKYPYAFTKVYAVDMPDKVPLHILIRKFVEQLVAVVLFVLRTVLVAFVWLILLPYGTLLTWRVYFRIGNILRVFFSAETQLNFLHSIIFSAWSISLHPHPNGSLITPPEYQYRPPHEMPTFKKHFLEPLLESLPSDIFSGQIIASLIVLAFLAIFLLREWIQQNARPGIFDDVQPDVVPHHDDVPAQQPPAPEPIPIPPQVADPVDPGEQEPEARNDHLETDTTTETDDDAPPRPLPDVPEDVRATDPSSTSSSDTERRVRKYYSVDTERIKGKEQNQAFKRTSTARRHSKTIRRRRSEMEEDSDESETRRHQKRRYGPSEQLPAIAGPSNFATLKETLISEPPSIMKTSQTPSGSKGKGKVVDIGEYTDETFSTSGATERESFSPPSDFEFTFSAPQQSLSKDDLNSRSSSPEVGSFLDPGATPSGSVSFGSRILRPSFDYPLPDQSRHNEPSSPVDSLQINESPSSDSAVRALRRPPLATSLPLPETPGADIHKQPSLVSPSLATYRPPEDLRDDDDVDYFEHPVDEDTTRLPELGDDDDDEMEEAGSVGELKRTKGIHRAPQLLPDTDEDEDEEELRNDQRDFPAIQVEFRQPLNPPVREGEQPAEVEEEDREQNLDEDLDGALEAVGLRGPVMAVFQNAMLMFFILNISIGGGIWVPFTVGKTVALLTLEPRQALYLLHLPIRTVRILTDPWVDGCIYFFRQFALPFWETGKTWSLPLLNPLATKTSLFQHVRIQEFLDHTRFQGFAKLSSGIQPTALWNQFVKSNVGKAFHDDTTQAYSTITTKAGTYVLEWGEDYFAVLGRYVRLGYIALSNEWTKLVENDGTAERVLAVLLGYTIAGLLAAVYLNTITVGNVRSVGRAIRNAIRQQMIVFKVALFIIVELVMFPFGCGVMLDLSTLPLFPDTTVEIRLAFASRAPVTAAFYHWLIGNKLVSHKRSLLMHFPGTMFMYQFAILLATCREVLRPGCMWFIKDPQDPTFHPIRDILDRPTLAQLRKLSLSAVMYAVVVTVGVGGVIRFLNFFVPSILPLRWKMREPLSEIPVDLLFVHLILPPTLHYFRPRKPVRRLMTLWWHWTARQLRLTSFMFGERHPDEEYSTPWSWKKLFGLNEGKAVVVPGRDGGFRRAPAGDNIAFLRDKPALVPIDEEGKPLDETGHDIIAAQDEEARRSGRNPAEDYTTVYVPPEFRKRVILFIIFFWLCGSFLLVSMIAIPTAGGRAVFRLFTPEPVHDGYSFIIGFYLVWWSYLVGSLFAKIRIRRQRHFLGRQFEQGEGRIRANWLLFIFKRVTVYFSKIIWLALWIGFIMPTLLSISVELYLVIPLRHAVNPNFTPAIHIFESWATGLILSKIILRTHRGRQGEGLFGALDSIRRNGWRRPDPWAATRDFIIPATVGLMGAIILPPLLIFASSKWIILPWNSEDLHRLIYPVIFIIVAAFQFGSSMSGVFQKWTQSIRDKEFLVEMRLRNLESSPQDNEMQEEEFDIEGDLVD
ncbi:hypothetical protein Clacol_005388 [Clathrus columnatus]|uniref:RING-type E3 ubiquitin transferase n=1 Tax=Clathrus columnatus TaxID=1419009 RepID=A0AAV5AC46_9AGAM|nr:hypothetical protein Clacol_005388 [Clathrus columnatus]